MNSPAEPEAVDLAIVGAGAAGLFCALHAARTAPGLKIVALDGAKKLGAKILVAGGGRCNVTHHAVNERDYHGSSRNAIRNVLRRYPVDETVRCFKDLGVELKREETGKLFPTTDSARTVLDALVRGVRDAGAEIRHPWRVGSITRENDRFVLKSDENAAVCAQRVVIAAGGWSLPKSGSNGAGERLVRSLGLPVTSRTHPALVPLTTPRDFFLCELSGVAFPARVSVRSATGKKLAETTGDALCTHFGLSGPVILDISRSLIDARMDDDGARLVVSVLPDHTPESIDADLAALGKRSMGSYLKSHGLPERLASALCEHAGVDAGASGAELRRETRRALVRTLTELDAPAIDARGWNYAEVTAGGVPLSALVLKTMESRDCPELHLCGEVCDVDGRIGGFNFQWAWSSGYVAGVSAAKALHASL